MVDKTILSDSFFGMVIFQGRTVKLPGGLNPRWGGVGGCRLTTATRVSGWVRDRKLVSWFIYFTVCRGRKGPTYIGVK